MSNSLLNLAMPISMSAAEKVVLIVLADAARDPHHVDRPSQTWLPMHANANTAAGLVERTCLSERTVQRALRSLEADGHISIRQIIGRGAVYTVHPRQSDAPDTLTPRQGDAPVALAPTPATVTPNPSVTTNIQTLSERCPGRSPSRGTPLPDDFKPILTDEAQALVARWPDGLLDREIAQWKDHHRTKGTKALDWQASLRTWLRNTEQWSQRNEQRGSYSRSSRKSSDQHPGGRTGAALARF